MTLFASAIDFFAYYAEHLPLELFVLLGSFLEEALSPIPSFVVLVPAGAAAEVQQLPILYLGVLALLAGIGRILGAVLLYRIATAFEVAVLRGGQRLFGVTHTDVKRLRKRLGTSRRRNWIVLFLMNGLPVFPTAMLSLACGFLKLPMRMFVTATFFGSILNAVAYLGIGYAGYKGVALLDNLELASAITTLLAIALLVGWFAYYLHRRRRPA